MLLTLTRWVFVASLLWSFGAALFLRVVPSSVSASIERRCRRVAGLSIAVALIAGLAWLLVEAGAMAETATLAETLAALPGVLLGTWFGTVLLAQGIALVGAGTALALFSRRGALPAGLAAAATLLEAGHSHAFAMSDAPSLLLLSQALHLLAAGAWLAGSCLCSSWYGRRRSMRLKTRCSRAASPV
jgi:putative copper resistance protein D